MHSRARPMQAWGLQIFHSEQLAYISYIFPRFVSATSHLQLSFGVFFFYYFSCRRATMQKSNYKILMARSPSSDDLAESPPPVSRWTRLNSKVSSWEFAVIACSVSALTAFLMNASIMFWLLSFPENHAGRRTIFEGNCDKAKTLNTSLHIAISALSTILLGSSSYCMQVLSAPTRAKVDKAHAEQSWLDVGIMSFRNLRQCSWKRKSLWVLLGLSSLPLHLL